MQCLCLIHNLLIHFGYRYDVGSESLETSGVRQSSHEWVMERFLLLLLGGGGVYSENEKQI